jgi:hypothetical protein
MNPDQNINPEEALAAVFGEPRQIADGITAFGPVVYAYRRLSRQLDPEMRGYHGGADRKTPRRNQLVCHSRWQWGTFRIDLPPAQIPPKLAAPNFEGAFTSFNKLRSHLLPMAYFAGSIRSGRVLAAFPGVSIPVAELTQRLVTSPNASGQ